MEPIEFDGHTLYTDETLNKLFGVMIECILTAGGDGDGVIVSKNYAYYAEKFENYLARNNEQLIWAKMTGEDFIYLHLYQDGMTFTSDRAKVAGWEEIVVELM